MDWTASLLYLESFATRCNWTATWYLFIRNKQVLRNCINVRNMFSWTILRRLNLQCDFFSFISLRLNKTDIFQLVILSLNYACSVILSLLNFQRKLHFKTIFWPLSRQTAKNVVCNMKTKNPFTSISRQEMQKLIFLTLLSSSPSILREQISRCPAYNRGQVHAIVFIHAGMFPKRFLLQYQLGIKTCSGVKSDDFSFNTRIQFNSI